MKVVIDTNVVVSANLSDEGLPAANFGSLAANKTIPDVRLAGRPGRI